LPSATTSSPTASIFYTGVDVVPTDANDDLSATEIKGFAEGPENIWSAGQNALRDLLLFLIQKHELDDVANPKIRLVPGFHIF
jgi:hypothetical protein